MRKLILTTAAVAAAIAGAFAAEMAFGNIHRYKTYKTTVVSNNLLIYLILSVARYILYL
jgi:hypothetical protein